MQPYTTIKDAPSILRRYGIILCEKSIRNWKAEGKYPEIFVNRKGGKILIDINRFFDVVVGISLSDLKPCRYSDQPFIHFSLAEEYLKKNYGFGYSSKTLHHWNQKGAYPEMIHRIGGKLYIYLPEFEKQFLDIGG